MRKLFTMLVIILITIGSTIAQEVMPEMIYVNKNDLTVEQQLKITAEQEAKLLEQRISTYGNWAGVGKEVGIAVSEGLNAVVDVADKFGGTNVGRFTMVLVAWKVVGRDLVRIAIGLLFYVCRSYIYYLLI